MDHQLGLPGILARVDEREPLPPEFQHVAAHFVQLNQMVDGGGDDWWAPEPQKPLQDVPAQPAQAHQPRWPTILLPPADASVKVQIIEDTATITIEHTFKNTSATLIKEAHYQFPLPHECSIIDFKCQIGNRTMLKGVVQPKPKARDTFEDAVRHDRPAGLIEQDTPEIFKTSIGNIPAHKTVTVEISFILLLRHHFSQVANVASTTLTLPTYIAPRYGQAPAEILQAGPRSLDSSLSIQVDMLASQEITEISSDTHRILVEQGVGRRRCQTWADFVAAPRENELRTATVKLKGYVTYLDKDFVLCFKTRPLTAAEDALACLEVHPLLENHRALMITIPPNFMLQNLESNDCGEIIFLADRSGSMSDKVDGLKSAMEFFIRGIPGSRKFNIWCFGSSYTSLWPQSRQYDQQTMLEALGYVCDNFKSNMGGTELLPALQAIVEARERNGPTDIVVLTDGEVWRQDETIEFVRTSRNTGEGWLRFFALGIGNAVSHDLIEGIAKVGGGYSEVIPMANKDNWESRMVAVLSAALTGHCGPLSIELDDTTLAIGQRDGDSAPTVHRSPLDVSTLSPFIRNRIFYLFEGDKKPASQSVHIKALSITGKPICQTIPVRRLMDEDLRLHKFAARSLLGDLERGRSWIEECREPSVAEVRVRREGERLGCKWLLVSRWTSFIAVKERPGPAQNPQLGNNGQAVGAHELGLLRPRGLRAAKRRLAVEGPDAARAENRGQAEEEKTETEDDTDQDTDDRKSISDRDGDSDDSPGAGGGMGPGSHSHARGSRGGRGGDNRGSRSPSHGSRGSRGRRGGGNRGSRSHSPRDNNPKRRRVLMTKSTADVVQSAPSINYHPHATGPIQLHGLTEAISSAPRHIAPSMSYSIPEQSSPQIRPSLSSAPPHGSFNGLEESLIGGLFTDPSSVGFSGSAWETSEVDYHSLGSSHPTPRGLTADFYTMSSSGGLATTDSHSTNTLPGGIPARMSRPLSSDHQQTDTAIEPLAEPPSSHFSLDFESPTTGSIGDIASTGPNIGQAPSYLLPLLDHPQTDITMDPLAELEPVYFSSDYASLIMSSIGDHASTWPNMAQAPGYIPPSSTAMVQPSGAEETTTETTQQLKNFVHKIIVLQQANGSFQFADIVAMRRILGDKVVRKFDGIPLFHSVVAITVLIVELLSSLFQSCYGLWSRASSKANDFVRHSRAQADTLENASDEDDQVIRRIKDLVAGITLEDLDMDGNAEHQVGSESVGEQS